MTYICRYYTDLKASGVVQTAWNERQMMAETSLLVGGGGQNRARESHRLSGSIYCWVLRGVWIGLLVGGVLFVAFGVGHTSKGIERLHDFIRRVEGWRLYVPPSLFRSERQLTRLHLQLDLLHARILQPQLYGPGCIRVLRVYRALSHHLPATRAGPHRVLPPVALPAVVWVGDGWLSWDHAAAGGRGAH